MAKLKVSKFLELIKRSGLVEDDQLTRVLTEIQIQRGGQLPEEAEALADRLVDSELLSRWQADNLLNGKHRGFILGKYKLLGHLGTGGMSSVYLAEHMLMKRQVAIKVLPPSKVEDTSYLERFNLEAQAAAALDDPNIVRAYDTDSDGKTHYLVMEYVDGSDLQSLVRDRGPIDYHRAVDYIAQAASGLAHAHQAGLIHRDVKPANLLVDTRGTVKVLDMGLAKFSSDTGPSLTLANDENVLGTADYLSPEQALNSHTVDSRADIYSLGCTLYYLLTGYPPFPEGTLPQRLMKHQTDTPKSILEFRKDAPADLVKICSRMMAKSPDVRYQSAGEVREELVAWLAARGKSLGGSSGGMSGELGRAAHAARRSVDAQTLGRSSEVSRTSPPPLPPLTLPDRLPNTGDTVSNADVDTIKSPAKKPAKSAETKSKSPATANSETSSGSGSGLVSGGGSEPDEPSNTSGSIFDEDFQDVLKLESHSSTKRSLKPAPSQTRRLANDPEPVWIYAVIGIGAVVVIIFLVALMIQLR